jgi:hypothetical protein
MGERHENTTLADEMQQLMCIVIVSLSLNYPIEIEQNHFQEIKCRTDNDSVAIC